MASTRKPVPEEIADGGDDGAFHRLTQELSAARRGPYQLTADIAIQPPTRRMMREVKKVPGDDEAQLAILLGATKDPETEEFVGGQYQAVEDLFADEDIRLWLAFQKDLVEHFFGKGATELPGGSSGS